MEALRITNTKLAHQCARCTRSYPIMFRQDDGLVYCSRNETCREIPNPKQVGQGPREKRLAKKATASRAG